MAHKMTTMKKYYTPPYIGKEIWVLFPQQMSQGWFEIDTLLKQKGKNIRTMINEYNQENVGQQLTMNLELEFWDELGSNRTLPTRRHYFDFDNWAWIPQLTEK